MPVSVVLPCYNDPVRLREALASVQAQSMGDWEVIIVDDGSDDQVAVRAVVQAFNDQRIQLYLSRYNRGAARARNLGVRLAQHRYLAFLDCDDLWAPDKLARQIAHLQQTGAALSCTGYRNLNTDTGATSLRVPPQDITYGALLGHNVIGCSTVMLDRGVLGRSYFPDIRMRQDFAHWLMILRAGYVAHGLAEVLTTRRVYLTALSAHKPRAVRYTWRMYREVMGFGVAETLPLFARYLWHGLRGG